MGCDLDKLKERPADELPNHLVMPVDRLRAAEGLALQTLDAGIPVGNEGRNHGCDNLGSYCAGFTMTNIPPECLPSVPHQDKKLSLLQLRTYLNHDQSIIRLKPDKNFHFFN